MLGRYSSEAASIRERSVNGSPIWVLFPFRHWSWDFEQVTSQEHPFPDLENWTSWIIFYKLGLIVVVRAAEGIPQTWLQSPPCTPPSLLSPPPIQCHVSCCGHGRRLKAREWGNLGCFPAHNLCVAHFAGLATSLIDTILWLKVPNLAWGHELLVLPESFIPEAFIKGLL